MKKPKIAAKRPQMVELEKGKKYAWCSCGASSNQPWCDGLHKDSGFKPLIFVAEEDKSASLCMCKQTSNPPYCDGTHNSLNE